MNFAKFVKERNEALLSLDRKKIERYCKKYGVTLPNNDEAFWLGVHKARCAIADLPLEERRKSVRWLHEHGSRPDIFPWNGGDGDA